jgi:hypothetical protein
MNDAFTDVIKEAFALAPSDKVIYHTLEIRQDTVQGSVFLVQSRRSITAFDENGIEHTFEPSGFQFSLPPSNEEGFRSLNIAIDNIGRRVSDFVEIAQSEAVPVWVIYRPYLSDDLSQPQMIPPLVLFLKDIEIGAYQVTGQATFMDIVNKKFPNQLYTRERFPALF